VKWTVRESLPSLFFFRSPAIGQGVRLNRSLSSRCGGSPWLSMDNLAQDNGVTRICCPCDDDRSVQLSSGIKTTDFVPRFSIMHGSVESRAAR
jgi:hypothetical protein